VFDDLDSTLRALLDDDAAPAELRNADVSFETPGKDYRPSLSTVNLFLHEVHENRELRDPVPITVAQDGMFSRALPPLRVDCSYLVTAWSSLDGAVKVATEHRLLGEALGWLGCFGTVPERFCRGRLVDQPYPPPTVVAQLTGRHDSSEFWHSLGTPPRPAFSLTVTVAVELAVVEPDGPRVETTVLRIAAPAGADGPDTE
jgi:hypothetical protein